MVSPGRVGSINRRGSVFRTIVVCTQPFNDLPAAIRSEEEWSYGHGQSYGGNVDMMTPRITTSLITVAFLGLMSSVASADLPGSPLAWPGRFFGYGWGNGYHARCCDVGRRIGGPCGFAAGNCGTRSCGTAYGGSHTVQPGVYHPTSAGWLPAYSAARPNRSVPPATIQMHNRAREMAPAPTW